MEFALKFNSSSINDIADRYRFRTDENALKAGERIRGGQYTRTNLEEIFEWKTKGRGRSRLTKNTNSEIADALQLAVSAKTDRAAIAVLMGLNGIQIPVASAVLTAIDPERFTIIDFRALESLSVKRVNLNINFYLEYLYKCRSLAKENNVSLRTLDRALWQWSYENSSGPSYLLP